MNINRGDYTRLAELTGLSRQHVSKVLRGKVGYSSKSLQLLADAMNVNIGDLAQKLQEDGVNHGHTR